MPIKTKRLQLRSVAAGDGKRINEAVVETWSQLKEWVSWAQGNPPTVDETEEVMRRFHAEFILRKGVHLAIFHDATFVGMCGFRQIDWETPSADIGYWLRTGAQKKGFATEAVSALTSYGFNEMGIKRITIAIDDKNKPSVALAERLGFTLEARAPGLIHPIGDEFLPIGRIYSRFNDKNLPPF